jgi:Flp pilus assembly protein TadD
MLLRVATRILDLDPKDVVARNNWAQLAMYQGIEKSRAHATARDLHERLPASLGLRATYAFALWQQDRAAEALALFKDAPRDQLEDPSIAACYGLVLAANGNRDEALRYLKIAQTSPGLLPSEQRLVAKALESLP